MGAISRHRAKDLYNQSPERTKHSTLIDSVLFKKDRIWAVCQGGTAGIDGYIGDPANVGDTDYHPTEVPADLLIYWSTPIYFDSTFNLEE